MYEDFAQKLEHVVLSVYTRTKSQILYEAAFRDRTRAICRRFFRKVMCAIFLRNFFRRRDGRCRGFSAELALRQEEQSSKKAKYLYGQKHNEQVSRTECFEHVSRDNCYEGR